MIPKKTRRMTMKLPVRFLSQKTSAPKKLFYGPLHRRAIRFSHGATSNPDHVPSGDDLVHTPPDGFSQQSLDPIANHGFAYPAAHRKTETAVIQPVGGRTQNQKLVGPRASFVVNPLKVGAFAKPIPLFHAASRSERPTGGCAVQAESFLRPFLRRFLITRRPALVDIRFRKP
jgi:hypothetical protein